MYLKKVDWRAHFCAFVLFSLQIPQLSSSRPMDIHEKFHIVPEGSEGTKRAVMIGINYVGQDGELSGCHNDVNNVSSHEPQVACAVCSFFFQFHHELQLTFFAFV